MDRRLKAYREHNVHDSGNSVQCFFNKIIGSQNVITINALDDKEKNFSHLQEFIERNGKPCCLNLITDRDLKFLKQLEKKKNPQPHQEEVKHEEHAEVASQQLDLEEEDDEDEVAKIIKKEEEEQARREEEAAEKKKQDQVEAEQRRVREEQERTKLEQIRQ